MNSNNIAIGDLVTLNDITTGIENIVIGGGAFGNFSSGNQNVALGITTGAFNNANGSVFLGSGAGVQELGSNKLYIGNSPSITIPLIYGEFDNDLVKINGDALVNKIGINMETLPSVKFQVNGEVILGEDASTLKEVLKVAVIKDIGLILSNDVMNVNFSVAGAEIGSIVIISPSADLPGSVLIGQARVSGQNNVRVRFLNEGSNDQDPGSMTYYITVIK